MDILTRNEQDIQPKNLSQVITCEEISELSEKIKDVFCSKPIQEYIVNIVETTRKVDFIKLGVSPRGSIAMYKMAKALAYVRGRDYVVPDDIKELAPYVFSHRIMLSPKGKSVVSGNEEAIERVVSSVEVPVA